MSWHLAFYLFSVVSTSLLLSIGVGNRHNSIGLLCHVSGLPRLYLLVVT